MSALPSCSDIGKIAAGRLKAKLKDGVGTDDPMDPSLRDVRPNLDLWQHRTRAFLFGVAAGRTRWRMGAYHPGTGRSWRN